MGDALLWVNSGYQYANYGNPSVTDHGYKVLGQRETRKEKSD